MYQNRIFIYNANHMYGTHFGSNVKFRGITYRNERRRFFMSWGLFKMRHQIKAQSHILHRGSNYMQLISKTWFTTFIWKNEFKYFYHYYCCICKKSRLLTSKTDIHHAIVNPLFGHIIIIKITINDNKIIINF